MTKRLRAAQVKIERIAPRYKGIPDSIRVTSKISYPILFSNSIGDDLGRCDPNTKQIIINPNQSDTELFKTLLHEIAHAMSFEHDINLTESQVQKLELALYRLIKLNFK